ncbi:MAG TPA: hypothetical protein VGJ14_16220 [Sporichthyaceae bacterium]|jgi:hypothetical protein
MGVALAGLLAVGSALGPSRLAGAVTRPAAAPAPGFLAAPTPVHVTAPTLRITALSAIQSRQPVALAGGGKSPSNTLLLEFARIDLDKLSISQRSSGAALAISNAGSGAGAAVLGGQDVLLWGVVHRLDVCLPPAPCTDLHSILGLLGQLVKSGALPHVINAKDLDVDIYALRAVGTSGGMSLLLPSVSVTVEPG